MKVLTAACRILVAVFVLFFCGRSFAQGCDEGIVTELVPCYVDKNGKVTDVEEQTCQVGGAGASACLYCYEGHGYCPDTGLEYTTANLSPDNFCPGCTPPSSCTGAILCGYRQFCLDDCTCQYASPIIVDTTGKGFYLTSAADGVSFDISGNGHAVKTAWTASSSGNAFLALDRNHNGKIDSGKELFGNFTEQPESGEPNGYLALAEFDKPQNGGNGDGIIDRRDAIYSSLLLWIDENHDGVSQPNELHTLPELGVYSISLHYTDDHHDDPFGNWFHYRAALNPNVLDGTSKDGRVTYDVFFVLTQNRSQSLASRSRIPNRRLELTPADDLAMAWLQVRKTGCRPKPQPDALGGAR